MQVMSSAAKATVRATRAQGGDVASLLRADTVLQGQQQAVFLENLRENTLNSPLTTKRSAAEVQRSQDQLAKWGRALQRLMMGQRPMQGHVTGKAAALVAGPAASAKRVVVVIKAERVSGVYTDWKPALSPQAHYTDAALADTVTFQADGVSGICGGDGDDTIRVDTKVGRREDMFDAQSLTRNAYSPADLRQRMEFVTGLLAQVDGGAGHDAMSVRVEGTIGVRGGSGDDKIALSGGTVGLFYVIGGGKGTVSLAPGTEAVVQITGATGYTAERGEDRLTMRIGAGSITFSGLAQSGAIGVQLGAGRGIAMLHAGQASLDRVL